MALKKPIALYNGKLKELQPGDTIPSAGATLTSITVAGVPYNSVYYATTIADASVSAASKIIIDWANILDTDENSPEMDDVKFLAIPGVGNFQLRIFTNSITSRLGGTYKLNYSVQ